MPARKNAVPVYPILEAKITEHGIKKKDIANAIGITPRALSLKLTGKVKITFDEALAIKQKFFYDISLETLFQKK